MTHGTNKEIARRFGQVWGRGDPSILDELASPEIQVFYPGLPAPIRGVEAFKQLLARVHAGLHDADCEFGDLVAEGEVVVAPWTLRGTHLGELMGAPASSKQVSWTGITIYRIRDGKVVDERGVEDGLGFLRQVGAMPDSAATS